MNRFKKLDVVKHKSSGRLYVVSVEKTDRRGVIIQDLETHTYNEVPEYMLLPHTTRSADPSFKEFDRVFLENHRVDKVFVVKKYYGQANKLEVFPIGQLNNTFHIAIKYVKLAKGAV